MMMTKSVLLSLKQPALMFAGALAVTSVVLGVAPNVLAQMTPTADPLKDIQNSEAGNDPFSNRGGNATSGMMDLIHRAMQGQSKSSEEYSAEQRENLDSAASEFRRLQQERLRQTPSTTPAVTPSPSPNAAN